MANQAEGTFGRLRYSLGGDRPSQTTRLALSHGRLHGHVIRRESAQEWYFTAASTTPTSVASQAPTYPTQARPRAQTRL